MRRSDACSGSDRYGNGHFICDATGVTPESPLSVHPTGRGTNLAL